MENKYSILIVDDEVQIRRLLRTALESHDYRTVEAETAKEAVQQAAMTKPDVVILDLGLPDAHGIEVVRQIRQWSEVPILILSALSDEDDKVKALDAGADDYITKPFGTAELLARIRTALRHSLSGQQESVFTNGHVQVDIASRTVSAHGEPIQLTATEYSLLLLFVRNIGKVLTQNHILREIWGAAFTDQAQYLRVYVGQLRKKLERDPSKPEMFITETGVGYRMKRLE